MRRPMPKQRKRQRNELMHLHGDNKHMVDAVRKVGGVTKKTAEKILEAYPKGQGLSQASVNALIHLGATPSQAERIHTAFSLVRYCDATCQSRLRKWSLKTPVEVAGFVRNLIGPREKEHFMILMLDSRQRVIEAAIISVGTLSQVDVHPRELFREAVRLGAHSIIMAHNHPSGDADPSQADLEITERMKKVGELVGIPVLDHLVVTPSAHVSIAESGGAGLF